MIDWPPTDDDIEAFRRSVLEQERRVVRAFAPRVERDAVCSGVRA